MFICGHRFCLTCNNKNKLLDQSEFLFTRYRWIAFFRFFSCLLQALFKTGTKQFFI